VNDGHVYGMNDGGEFGCVRLSDGKTIWLAGHHGFYCTPVLAGNKLLCLNERGRLFVMPATPKSPDPLGETQLTDRATWTSPAVVGRRLYIRGVGQLLGFDLP
jgi:hypothetical protein